MEAKDVIQLLRMQRHDLMNDLQIVHGYLSMDKTEKVKAKVDEILTAFNQERLLMNINCPNFALWLIQLNWLQPTIRLTYNIHKVTYEIAKYDDNLKAIGQTLVNAILASMNDNLGLVEGKLVLKEGKSSIDIEISLMSENIDIDAFKVGMDAILKDGSIFENKTESRVVCTFSFPA